MFITSHSPFLLLFSEDFPYYIVCGYTLTSVLYLLFPSSASHDMKSSFARRQPRKLGQDDDEDDTASGQHSEEGQEKGTYTEEPDLAKLSDMSRRNPG